MKHNDALIRIRTDSGLDKEQIAIFVGVHTGTYLKWENGRSKPHLRHIRKLCEIFQAKPKDLGYDEFE